MTTELIEQYGDRLRSHSVEVPIPTASNGKFMLPDDSILRNEKIVALFVPDNQDDSAKSPLGNTLVSNAAVRSGFLNLKFENEEVYSDHPLSDLLSSSSDRSIRRLEMAGLNPSKSWVVFGNTALISDGESLLLHFIYVKP